MPKSSRDLFSPDVFDLKSFISPYMMVIPPTIFALLIWWTDHRFGFLFTHTVAELISIIIALTALIVTVVSRHFTKNYFVVFIAIAIGWCGFIDLFHTLLYKGMQILPVDSANQATQLWIGARLLQAFAMLAAPFMLTRAIKPIPLNLLFGLLSVGIVTAVMLGFFPTAFIDGQGLTPFKIYSEYLIIAVLALALVLVWQRREYLSVQLRFGVSLSVLTMMASEFAFTQYISVYADANLLGHILKVYSYWFIYLALVESTIKEPFSMLSKAASTYDTIPDPTYIVSSSQMIQQVNLAAAQLHGIPATQLTGRSVHELVHDPRVKAEDCPVCSRLQQAPQEFLIQLTLPDHKTVECHVAPFAERLGKKTVWVMVVHDITDRQRLLQDLQERVKEVRCLNQINQLCNNTQFGMTELLQKVMKTIPSGFSSPERIHLQIHSDWGIFGAAPPAQTPCLQSVFANETQQFGTLTVWYDQVPDATVFLDEEQEQNLIDHITSQITDVYTRLQSQGRVARLSYLYQLLSETNRVIAHSQNQQELLNDLQQVLLKLGSFAKIFIALKNDDQADSPLVLKFHHNISVNILPTLQTALQQYQNTPLNYLKNTSPEVDVYTYALINDPDESVSPEYQIWIHYLKQEQICQAALTPLLFQGHFCGLVALYTTGQVEFDEEQIQLLKSLSRDISFALERFSAEQQLQTAETYSEQMEQRFQQVFLQSPVPMQIISIQDERILAVNLAYEKWLGYRLEDFQDREAWLKKVAPDAEQRQVMQQNWKDALQLAKDGKQVQFPEITFLAKDGSPRIAQRTLAVMSNDVIVAWNDVSAIRKTEQELRDSEQRFRGMVEQTVVGMYVLRDNQYLYVNPSYANMLGRSAAALIGHNILEFSNMAADTPALIDQEQDQAAEHSSLSCVVPFRHQSGQIREFALHSRRITWDDGLPASIVMAQDITEQKQAQDQIAYQLQHMETIMYGTLQAVSTMVELRDPYTAGHERRVGLIASAIAKEMGWDEKHCRQMEEIGLVHDIGKIAIPSEILTKPSRLTYLEMEMMKGHAQAGYDILKDIPFNIPIAEIIGQHHERMDGTGYPKGLKGDEIHPEARILTVADVIESMASHRPYRAALGIDVALSEILRGRGTIYDAEVCDAAVRLIKEKGYVLPS